ncbi:3'-5' exonuclease [Marispirochaeta aestuarii]|uniref:3'-5' exonuclease n=1 Tax=Marispirochaeta aestuarii TaxID=1963862 RepID=UPI0029C86805|nr:3'-5' exonuclease [Marispirochaeta aestuarii]
MEGFLDFYSPRQEELPYGEALFCALDFETTGLYPGSDSIIEAGAVLYRGGQEIDSFSSFIRPAGEIPAAATAVHGIDTGMVKDAPELEEVFPSLLVFLEGAILVGHNINFDLAFLDAGCRKSGKVMPSSPGIDTCSFARSVLKGEPSYSLENLSRRYGLGNGNHHRALDDARAAMGLLSLIVSRIPDAGELKASDIIRRSRTRPYNPR